MLVQGARYHPSKGVVNDQALVEGARSPEGERQRRCLYLLQRVDLQRYEGEGFEKVGQGSKEPAIALQRVSQGSLGFAPTSVESIVSKSSWREVDDVRLRVLFGNDDALPQGDGSLREAANCAFSPIGWQDRSSVRHLNRS